VLDWVPISAAFSVVLVADDECAVSVVDASVVLTVFCWSVEAVAEPVSTDAIPEPVPSLPCVEVASAGTIAVSGTVLGVDVATSARTGTAIVIQNIPAVATVHSANQRVVL
jgi:hypothetical protein